MPLDSHFTKAMGSCPVYGTTPALDMSQYIPSQVSDTSKILLVAASDARHLFKTIARSYRHSRRMEIYIMESQAPLLTRTLLQLSLLLSEQDWAPQEQTEMFLEVYGNSFLREKTSTLVTQLASELIRVVTDDAGKLKQHAWARILDLDMLKFRDRDDLEFTFKFWRDQGKSFDMSKLREMRMRMYYGIRYDARENLADWDYQMNMVNKASIVHPKEFARWRETGIAFEVRDSNYNQPNRTMATVDGLKEDGLTVTKWGYFSDIILGPFIPFGIEADEPKLFEKRNEMPTHTSQDVSEYNIRSLLHELQTGTAYSPNETAQISQCEHQFSSDTILDRIRIHLLPCGLQASLKKRQLQNAFHVVYVSNNMTHFIPQLSGLLSSDGVLVAETAKFMLELTRDQQQAFTDKTIELGKQGGMWPQNTSGNNLVFHPNREE